MLPRYFVGKKKQEEEGARYFVKNAKFEKLGPNCKYVGVKNKCHAGTCPIILSFHSWTVLSSK